MHVPVPLHNGVLVGHRFDTATYLFVHLNVESIGHLVVLSDRRKNTTKLAINIVVTPFYLCTE